MNKPTTSNPTAYLAFEGFEQDLQRELASPPSPLRRLFLLESEAQHPVWAQDVWQNCETLEIESISDAVRKLKARGRNWMPFSWNWHRRGTLIQEGLPRFKVPPLEFMTSTEISPFGVWTLLEPNRLLLSTNSFRVRPLGEMKFNEDKETPPSRAYLKLWELFTAHKIFPAQGARVIDLGSSPGGWTWVLQHLGCEVTSVDKAPLDPRIAELPRIHTIKKDAFKLEPADIPQTEWLFSDIICYPQKLLEFLQPWIERPVNLVCTIKFQGPTDWNALKAFSQVPQSRIIHLFHNKHEVTWIRLHAKK